MNIIEEITCKLPPVEHFDPQGEVDFYGFGHIIAQKIGLTAQPFSYGGWQHGWNFIPLENINQVIVNYDPKKFYFVATETEVEFLNSQGIYNVKAGGMPFVYAEERKEIKRIPRSLLVMPGHITKTSENRPSYTEDEYIEYIKSFRTRFDHIVFCLHGECVRQGKWLSTLQKNDLPYIIGADNFDRNTLVRIRTIMSHFECMTTNQMGSHVLYTSLCGCKTSVAGKFQYVYPHTDDPHEQKIILLFLKYMTSEKLQKAYPQFFVEPDQATQNIAWAKEQAGVANILPPEEIAKLLGWNNSWIQRYGKYAGALAQCKKKQVLKRAYCHLMKRIAGMALPH